MKIKDTCNHIDFNSKYGLKISILLYMLNNRIARHSRVAEAFKIK